MSPRSFSELVLVVHDVAKAAAFYRDLVGLTPARPQSSDWAWFWVGPPENHQRLAVHKGPLLFEEFSPRPPGQRFGPIHFALEVARQDLNAMADRLRRANIPVHGPQRFDWMNAESFYFYDPDDNLVELWSPIRARRTVLHPANPSQAFLASSSARTRPPILLAHAGRSPRLLADSNSRTAPRTVIQVRAGLPAAICSLSGVGYYLPETILTNEQLSATVDTSDQWIVERTGIHGRHCADASEATSDLAFRAGTAALADANLSPADVDLILFATSTPDTPVPATACYLQARLGCRRIPAMDIGAGCSGFGTALHMAGAAVKSGMHHNVLVLGADTLTRITNYADRQSCILFGDGAGAAVVSSRGFMDVIYSDIGADGSLANLIRVPAGGSREPASVASVAGAKHTLELRGREVFKSAVRQMCECIRQAADRIGVTPADFDVIIPHQANARIIEAIGAQLEVSHERLVIDIADTGNTAAASIPVALGRARQRGLLSPGQLVAVVGFGAGLAWACQVLVVKDR